jgi:erythronate-4-phosphate dehydrogenase
MIFIEQNIPFLKNALAKCGATASFKGRTISNRDLIQSDCEFLFVRSTTKVNEQLLQNTKVKFVGTATSGTDHIDEEYLKSNNIRFASAAGSNANSVAEYVVYNLLRRVIDEKKDLKSLTAGIIGFGHIGKLVARYAKLLGMNIYVNDPPLRDNNFIFPDYVRYMELNEIFENCDLLTNHVPLTETGRYPTKYVSNGNNLSQIKEKSIFIHSSRGKVVDEDYLLSILKNKKITAITDVWDGEPDFNCQLALESRIATPHTAGYSFDGKVKGSKMMLDAFRNFTGLEPDYYDINQILSDYIPLNEYEYNFPEKILNLLTESRKLEEDSKEFKKLIKLNREDKISGFEKFRTYYRNSREIL